METVSIVSTSEIKETISRSVADAIQSVVGLSPNRDATEKAWLSNREAAKYLNLSKTTLQRYRTSGVLPHSKLGGNIFYRRSDIEALLERNMRTSTSDVCAAIDVSQAKEKKNVHPAR